MLSKFRSTPSFPAFGSSLSLFSTENCRCGFMLVSTSSKLSGVTSTNLRSLSLASGSAGCPREIAENSHDEWQLLHLDRAARLDVVADLNARRTDALEFFLCTLCAMVGSLLSVGSERAGSSSTYRRRADGVRRLGA